MNNNTDRHHPTPAGKLATAEQVGEYFSVSSDLIYLLARRKEIPSIKIGRLVRFRLEEVEAALVGPDAVAVNS